MAGATRPRVSDVATAVISTERLTKRFPSVIALSDLTLEVGTGVTGLVGSNGAGKSTLIKILLGLLPASSGQASVLGLDVVAEGPAIRARVGYMPEHDCLPPDVTATELVVHMARMSGLSRTSARERAADTLRHVGLYEERYRPIGGYSTGMRQRVKLAQALVHDPQLVLLDEPTNGLDPVGRDDMLSLIRRIGGDFGISVLVTSHLLGELERVSDHVVVLDGGALLSSQATTEFTRVTQVLTVEVTDPPDRRGDDLLHQALEEHGLVVRRDGRLLNVDIADDATYDVIRDQVAGLGLGLIRLQQQRHHMADIFQSDVAQSTGDDHDGT